ncbi:DarT ssDNA thymidine ADP-ribosyltransferase family protein [Nitrospira sp. KM1]|uniref:DarT ssDNA thymidine ADP-ribosyltransferase family protein n=1 Tax=Nitrospira sp. KM1 TaxID=1936990 RepID=UPI00156708A4
MAETDFRSSDVKEGKQAEFLVHGSFPWELVRRIGVYSARIKAESEAALQGAAHRPPVEILRDWYY